MDYWQGVAQRFLQPGTALIVLGALLCYGSGWVTQLLHREKGSSFQMTVKIAGAVIAAAGAVLIFTNPNIS